ncbi:MAG: MarR family winged helix-turn-helix transcriptional regulator [Cytophagaceae bacterium]
MAKKTLGVLSEKLEHTGLDRFFYPLLVISREGGTLSQQSLSCILNSDKVTTLRIIDYLSKKGLVKRVVNKNDRREHLLTITPKAEKIIPKIEKGFMEFEKDAFQGISKQDKASFMEIMNKVDANISLLPSRKIQVRMNYNKNKAAR